MAPVSLTRLAEQEASASTAEPDQSELSEEPVDMEPTELLRTPARKLGRVQDETIGGDSP